MALHIVMTPDEQLVGMDAQDALRAALGQTGRAVLLTPSFTQALEAQKVLARAEGLSLGVQVTTPAAWADDCWEAWGDGTRPVGTKTRLALMRLVLDEERERQAELQEAPALPGDAAFLSGGPGMLSALCELARDALPWMLHARNASSDTDVSLFESLSEGEQRACSLVCAYAQRLRARGLRERAEIASRIPELLLAQGIEQPDMVCCGFTQMSAAAQHLLAALSRQCEVSVVLADDGSLASYLARTLGTSLAKAADEAGALCSSDRGEVPAQPYQDHLDTQELSEELQGLSQTLFHPDAPKLTATGAVIRLEPAGPQAEAEALARTAVEMVDNGAQKIIITVADVARAWHDLAPKLAARGMLCRCGVRRHLMDLPAARSFMGYARSVVQLDDLARTWPEAELSEDGPVPQLGDMTWWPPRDLTDFLLSDLAHLDAPRARNLDKQWRANRMLTPQDVLADLQSPKKVSSSVVQATQLILKGRLGSAALALGKALLDPAVPPEVAKPQQKDLPAPEPEARAFDPVRHQEELDVLQTIQILCRDLGKAGITASESKKGSSATISLVRLVALVEEILCQATLLQRLELGPQEGSCIVRICSRSEAALLAPRSADALMACSLNSAEYDLAKRDDAVSALEEHLGMRPESDPLDRARYEFARAARVPRSYLALERVTHDSDVQETYPAVVLAECLGAYGVSTEDDASELPEALIPRTWGEDTLIENVSCSGATQESLRQEQPIQQGTISEDLKPLIMMPRQGDKGLYQGLPSLSATQIEAYLECPLKWFTQRRLGISSLDAGFSPLQMGSFVHRVLEVSRREQALGAAKRAGLLAPDDGEEELFRLGATPVPGAAPTPETLEEAQHLVDEEFERHLRHQRQTGTKLSAQSLVPHTETEQMKLSWLQRDLLSETSFEASCLTGFEPRAFEMRFGSSRRKDAAHVVYAGIDLSGTVDRIDINHHGVAVLIDYKYKGKGSGDTSFAKEYDSLGGGAPSDLSSWKLPRRVQALMYAQVIRRAYPDLKVGGAVYLSVQGGRKHEHEIAGLLDDNCADLVLGAAPSKTRTPQLVCGAPSRPSFEDVLDECEGRIADVVGHMLAGEIPAQPIDAKACAWCPVHDCEKRLS